MKDKLTSLQFSVIYYYIILSCYSGMTNYSILNTSFQDSWISIIIGGIIGIIPLVIFYYIFNYEENLSLTEKNIKLFGKVLGNIINIIIILTILCLVTICSFNLTSFVNFQFLDKTPIFIISILFLIPIIYVLSKGLRVLGRTTIILFFISAVLLVLTLIGLLLEFDINNIKPIFGSGFSNIFSGSIKYVAYNILPLFLLLFIPKNNISNSKNLSKKLIIFYIISNVVILISNILVICVLGINLATLLEYPEYNLLTRVSIAGFIDRIEGALSIRWIFYLFIIISIGLMYIKYFLQTTFKFKEKVNDFIIYFITFVCIIGSNFIFRDIVLANVFFNKYWYFILIFSFLIIPLVIFFKILLKKKN